MIEFCSRLSVSLVSLAYIVKYDSHISTVVSEQLRRGFLSLCTPVAPSAPPEALTSSMSLWRLYTALWQGRWWLGMCTLHSREEMCFYVIRDVYHRHNTLFAVMLNSSTDISSSSPLNIQLKILARNSCIWFWWKKKQIFRLLQMIIVFFQNVF